MDCHHKIRWMLYSSFAAFFIFLSVSEVSLFRTVKNAFVPAPYHSQEKYVIVFDGGSTGTRIHVFKFLNSTAQNVMLQDEFFEETKPGLSSYAHAPKNAAESIHGLLEKAKTFIPIDRWSDTPVSLKATAGLRLLSTYQADSILQEVSNLIKNSPFLCGGQCVGVLDDEDEGVFAWFTLNFLLGHLQDMKHSVALLDLGGGSTQVTFAPSDFHTFASTPSGLLISRSIQGKILTLYSHSYLGLGLMSARLSILRLTTKDYDDNETADNKVLESPCMSPSSKVSWKHGLRKYTVKGLKSSLHDFEVCYKKVNEFLNNTVHKPDELLKREVIAVSYYFDRAVDLGILGPEGGVITVGQFMEAAVKECSKEVPIKPFLCLDATYITALLHNGLGLSKQKEITLVQQVKGIEASWGLGAAFSLLK